MAAAVTSKIGTAVAIAVAIAIAAGVGYELHKAAKKRNEQRALVSVVSDTTSQLRNFLKTPERDALAKIEGNLRVAKTWSNPLLADAIEQYLVGAREIMRRRAEADRVAEKAAVSRAALMAHMNRASRRDPRDERRGSSSHRRDEPAGTDTPHPPHRRSAANRRPAR